MIVFRINEFFNLKVKLVDISNYNPSGVGVKDSLFGLPYTVETADLVILPVPWEITASAGSGSSLAPKAIFEESPQLDLELYGVKDAHNCAVAMLPIDEEWVEHNAEWRRYTSPYIAWLEEGQKKHLNVVTDNLLEGVNGICNRLQDWIQRQSEYFHQQGKTVAVLGGEHSVSLGLIRALANKHDSFGILQIDAHADLRKAYEGFEHSHASIMYNALKLEQVTNLTQVGIRDYAQEETALMKEQSQRITTFFDQQLKEERFQGKSWHNQCESIIANLPQKVYISFDIDGLQPSFCPNTGTPVPGGLTFEEALYLVTQVVKAGKEIIGFDLVEVAPKTDNRIDALVGARVLYFLSCLSSVSQGRLSFED